MSCFQQDDTDFLTLWFIKEGRTWGWDRDMKIRNGDCPIQPENNHVKTFTCMVNLVINPTDERGVLQISYALKI